MSIEQQFWKAQQKELQRKLEDFEECAETPFVPGELESWLTAAGKAYDELRPQFQLQTDHIHAEEFAEIAEEDPELLSRVEEMRQEDQELKTLCNDIANRLKEFQRKVEKGASETDLKEDLEQFVSIGLDFVMRVRKQEVTVRTWLMEAFTRDRGTVD